MMNQRFSPLAICFLAIFAVACFHKSTYADPGRITVHVNRPGATISPLLYGLMTEEINHSYDGGLYAELIQNRAFSDDPQTPVHWSAITSGNGKAIVDLDRVAPPRTALTASLRVDITHVGKGSSAGAANDGYWGIPVWPQTRYHGSFYARTQGKFHGPLMCRIESADGKHIYAQSVVPRLTTAWKKYSFALTSGQVAATAQGRFTITAHVPGTFFLTQVSLFPPTYRNRPNGNRIDLMQKLAALHPALLRFPGGNYLEGDTIATRFNWKKTLGPIEQRPGHRGPWGYRSTDGLGLSEFLGWCDDLHMQPLLAVYAGYSLNHYKNPNPEVVKPGPALVPYVQDALDEIEYITGSVKTKWGAQRARDGHPKPFSLNYVEIGNEDWFDQSGSYDGRFAQFSDAIKAKYPRLKLIATTRIRSRTPDLYDEHYYRSPLDMERNATQYDHYDRHAPKVFVGEWASQEGNPTPDMNSALGDAAWMIGMERNADVIAMSTYAPLLVNINPGASQWGTNLIGYNALSSFGSPSYYAQTMFGANRGDVVLPVDLAIPQPKTVIDPHPPGNIGVGTWDTQAEFKDIQVTHAGSTLYSLDRVGSTDWQTSGGSWKIADGMLQQTGEGEDVRAVAGDHSWTDYTLTLKARKTGGSEGFLILVHTKDEANWVWWNVGGWGNTRSAVERSFAGNKVDLGMPAPVTVETGRWYDVKIEVAGPQIRCYLDGKLITEVTDAPPPAPPTVYACASRDRRSGDVILKVVNTAFTPQSSMILLDGMTAHRRTYTINATVLAGAPEAINTLTAPTRIVPQHSRTTIRGTVFPHTFPAHSITVLRVS